MTRIQETFEHLKRKRQRALITYITAGDPDPDTTGALLRCLVDSGADMIELGIPFSDPMADGPTIQAASQRALQHPFSMDRVFELVRRMRTYCETPVILFGYYNPFLQYGLDRLCKDAQTAGADALLVVDLPPEEAGALHQAARCHQLDMIFLLAPTSTPARMKLVASMASGFIYYVSVTGVTGARDRLAEAMDKACTRIRRYTDLPIGIGFGVSRPEHVRAIAQYADAVIVGSALIKIIESRIGKTDMKNRVAQFVRSLKQATQINGTS
ncbi:MAG: tryptophan synthase subunit alpha [Desulfobacterota bacterium]|nr:tryptophan synthase subunit alpha [Thermodesulfobacteriota bacterium]